jgi:hypothetical protein
MTGRKDAKHWINRPTKYQYCNYVIIKTALNSLCNAFNEGIL